MTSASAARSRRWSSPRRGVRHVWHPAETVQAVAYDTPVVGWRGEHVNTLRLWSARAADPLKLDAFNHGDHVGALADRVRQESDLQGALPVGRDPGRAGAAAASRSISSPPPRCRTWCGGTCASTATCSSLPDQVAIQLNDTHPAIAVPELMRICVDLHGIPWDEAWAITQRHPQLHQPHPAAGGAGELAGAADGAAAAAPHADHLPDQRLPPRPGARRASRATGGCSPRSR